ncbi:MAG: hypothetical protein OEV42_10310 [Deltaproteobacteria bacterium]|nr:hypothetical protein [Deltaproteobacteria bacterium]
MNLLISKILEHDQNGVLELITANPELLNQASESNRSPIEVAKATGNPYIYVTLLRHYEPNHKIEENWYELLTEYISQISNDWICSSWNKDIEYEIWHAIKGNPFCISGYDEFADLTPEIKNDLEYLSLKVDGWAIFEENQVVPIEKWNALYNEWLHQKYA